MRFNKFLPVVLIGYALLFCFTPSYAEQDNDLPKSLLYPKYFQKTDEITWENVKTQLRQKMRFLFGFRHKNLYMGCHKFQKRIANAIDRTVSNNENLPFDEIDNRVLFSKYSRITEILSPQPTMIIPGCSYHSYGDIRKGCVLYCDVHGTDFDSEFYKKNKEALEAAKPFITSGDVAEIILFSPSLLMFPIIYFGFLRKKKS